MTADRFSLAVRRFVLVAVIVPAVLTIASLVVQLIALPHVPSTIAIHWGASGDPDGFGPAWLSIVVSVGIGIGIPLLLAAMSLPGLRRGDRGPTYRLLGAVAAGMSALSAVIFPWTLVVQQGLADPKDAPSVLPAIVLGLSTALLVGVAAWFVQPKHASHNTTTVAAGEIALAPGEQAAWFGTASMARGAVVAIGASCVLVAAAAILTWFAGAPAVLALILGGVAVVLTVAAFTTTVFHVRVDAAGLSVASPFGFPRFRVPLADVRSVHVSDVNPMGEFGGYGIRSVVGGTGIVLRRGPAIDVTRTSGRRFVVTVDDADRGAALLEALVRRDVRAA